ncbi:hypothetical protein OAS86_04040 [Gammaproteobacteria bacterium]|nr:hypothetical protein [Gammaproteobacteria bacterium]
MRRIVHVTMRVVAVAWLSIAARAEADTWLGWWLTADQQGRLQYQRGNYLLAARAFEDTKWKGLAYYAAGDFGNAAQYFAQSDDSDSRFLAANALARQEKLGDALAQYQALLAQQPDFSEALFNRDWVQRLIDLDALQYQDAGGTGGKLGADRVVYDHRAQQASGEVTARELAAEQGLSESELQRMWMRRVQTTPADFLSLKFAYQWQAQQSQRDD